ncbi:MAG: Dyp-type peroxidase [Corynebacterium sp.]|nr:Dyp-type peroxidase [Corynebacterium sp.]
MSSKHEVTRRGFLGVTTTLAGGAAFASHTNAAAQEDASDASTASLEDIVAFDGAHQAGIDTPAQSQLNLIAFDFRAGATVEDARRLLTVWTEDARRLCAGQNPLGSLEPEMVEDPARLTITCGVGARFFDIIGKTEQRPSWLTQLPSFEHDHLDPQWAGGDIVLQICCDDPLYLAFATRHMIRAGIDYVQQRWRQGGFLPTGPATAGTTPRNLFGQKDGTVNPRSAQEFDEQVWINSEDDSPEWLHGGSAMVVRRIEMHLDSWEQLDRFTREVVTGRTLDTGAPLGQNDEFDEADYELRDAAGIKVIDPHSHMALASPVIESERFLRRAYNYDEPVAPDASESSNSGLVFICFQRDPRKQFIPVQQRLAAGDRMNEWITHIGSAVFAIFPGTSSSDMNNQAGAKKPSYLGQQLLES